MAIPENVLQFVEVYDPSESTTTYLVDESRFDRWCREHQAEIYTAMDVEDLTYEQAQIKAYLRWKLLDQAIKSK